MCVCVCTGRSPLDILLFPRAVCCFHTMLLSVLCCTLHVLLIVSTCTGRCMLVLTDTKYARMHDVRLKIVPSGTPVTITV